MRSKKKCAWCWQWFDPHPRLKIRQQSCGNPDCKRKQNLLCQRLWKKRERENYRKDQRDWRKDHPDYWKTYRKKHPAYTKRNRIQSKIRSALSRKTLQKKLDILEVSETAMEYWNLPRFAKQTRSLTPLIWAYTGLHELTCGQAQPQAP